MLWQDALHDYHAWMMSGNVAQSTLRIYTHYLLRLAALVAPAGPFSIGLDELAMFLSVATWAPATRKTARSAVRSFYSWACTTGRMDADPSRRLRVIRVPAGLPRPAPDAVVDRALATASPRDRIMVMLGAYAGLRRSEIAKAHRRDMFGPWLRVHGKGGRVRDVPLHPVIADELARWPERGWIFPGKVDGHLSADRVGHVLAELLGASWTAHTLRHRFLSLGYLADRDILAVKELGGHAKLDTVMVYTKVPDGALMRAVMAAGPSAA